MTQNNPHDQNREEDMQTLYEPLTEGHRGAPTKTINVIGVDRALFNWLRGFCTENEIPTGVAMSEAIQMYKREALRRGLAEREEDRRTEN